MLKKNDIIELDITALTNEGSGMGRTDGMVIFVPFSAIGDKIHARILKVKTSYAYAKIEDIITPSPDRVTADCKVFGKCGGCTFRHISYEAEKKAKEGFVKDAFERIGGLSPEFLPIGADDVTDGYRNKLQMPYAADEDGNLYCGFFAHHTHRVVRSDDCRLQQKDFTEVVNYFTQLCNENNISAYDEKSRKGILRHIYIRRGHYTGEICVSIIATKRIGAFQNIAEQITVKFPMVKSVVLNINPDDTNVILGEKEYLLCGNETISDIMCGNKIELSPKSFYQVNTAQAERLYGYAADAAQADGKFLLDLYCGAGTVGLSMAKRVRKLIGVEIVPEAIENAKRNAKANGISNAEFICADAGEAAAMLAKRGERPDVIVVDPPRKGCTQEAVKEIAAFGADRIVMISCNAATAARDCAYFKDLGYETISVRPVDLFPRTVHVECVVLLTKEHN